MNKTELKKRLFDFAVEIVFYTEILPNKRAFEIFKKQIIRSGSSSAANYRAACRAKSTADFINKLKIVEEELDETMFWLEIISAVEKTQTAENLKLFKEADELLSIIVKSIITSRNNL
jgi:four helix bundle protein